ncbi:MAG: hypothetical protein WD044_03495 [Dongiaceae bacterium]
MAYNFANLSPADLEDLARDLIGREIGVRFESFTLGPDGGIDGRHAKGKKAVILQVKHFFGSTYPALRREMKNERAAIEKLSPKRYILATSRGLTPRNKEELSAIVGPALKTESDIFGPGDFNGLIRKYPDIEKSHIKLWLSGSAVLERVVQAAAHSFNRITRSEIETKVRVYASNPSLKKAHDLLETHHVVIISGPPGVGKTTLAEMLAYAYGAEDWDLIAIRSLDDGFAAIDDTKRQMFFFDDFLGKVALDRRALSQKDSDLVKIIKRVQKSPNARFILTTRAYIFEEARHVSENLSDQHLRISTFMLDVGAYTRRIRARILYNHLLVAPTPRNHVIALVQSGKIREIIDHRNYSPRIVEWMTDVVHIGDVDPAMYPSAFIYALDHPRRLWDTAFRTHISRSSQHLLFAVFFSSEYGVGIDDLRLSYERLHPHLCAKYGEPHGPKDFEEALRILEGGFIVISGKQVGFINPSLRDYLIEYLNDLNFLIEFATCGCRTNWARLLWQHGAKLNPSKNDMMNFALSFSNIAEEFVHLPVWKRVRHEAGTNLYVDGISNTERIALLLKWWKASGNMRFLELAKSLAHSPIDGFDSWRDGDELVDLIVEFYETDLFDDAPLAIEIAAALETGLIDMIDSGMSLDELSGIVNQVDLWKSYLGNDVSASIDRAIRKEFDEVRSSVSTIESESTLNDHIETLQKFAKRVPIPESKVDRAIEVVQERIEEIEEQTPPAETPSFDADPDSEIDQFDNDALTSLFAPLAGSSGAR